MTHGYIAAIYSPIHTPLLAGVFFGRESILAALREAITTAKPSGIFGLRKVGKTSLLKECARRADANGDLAVYVDLLRVPADVSDARWLYWRIAQGLHEEVSKKALAGIRWRLGGQYDDFLDVPPSLPVSTAFDSDLSSLLAATPRTRSAQTNDRSPAG